MGYKVGLDFPQPPLSTQFSADDDHDLLLLDSTLPSNSPAVKLPTTRS